MINDTIQPMGLDLTKNLHGYVRVETRDRWSGKVVDSTETENLVTQAVSNMYMLGRWSESGLTSLFTPIYKRALGGILLFDGALTESASNIYFPSSPKLIAYAGQTANASDPQRGSLNSPECIVTPTSATTVWDFSTSQANGTIASLARTSSTFEDNPSEANVISLFTNSGLPTTKVLGQDASNNYIYLALGSGTVDGIAVSATNIYRAKLIFLKIGLTDCVPPVSQWTSIKTLTSADGVTDATTLTYDKYANNFLYIGRNSATLHIIDINGTHSTETLPSMNSTNIAATENYYWRWGGSTVYRIEKADTANVETIALSHTVDGAGTAISTLENDLVVVGAASSNNWDDIIYPDLTKLTMVRGSYGRSNNINASFMSYPRYYQQSGSMRSNTALYNNYLGTIANLGSPVTKTSSQTMKVTYTLTEA